MISVHSLGMNNMNTMPSPVDSECIMHIPRDAIDSTIHQRILAAYIVTRIKVLSPISETKIRMNDYVNPDANFALYESSSSLTLIDYSTALTVAVELV
jgi:hypothetical protein